jgi:hypothetical protein
VPAALSSPSRRTLVLTGLALVATGCDLDPRTEAEPAPAPTSGVPSAVSEDADIRLRDQARAMVMAVSDFVGSVRRDYPRLRQELAGLQALHRIHLALLDDVAPESGDLPVEAPVVTAEGPRAALAQLRTVELGHQRGLGRLAIRTASGSFARMLASMSAGVAAHLAALPEELA